MYSGTGLYFHFILSTRHSFTLFPLLEDASTFFVSDDFITDVELTDFILRRSSPTRLTMEYKDHTINGFQSPASSVWRPQFSFPSFLLSSPKFRRHLLCMVSVSFRWFQRASKLNRDVLIIPTTLDSKVCDGAVTLASIWIGKGKDVEIKSVYCPNLYQPPRDVQHALEPQTAPLPVNVCGAPCKFSRDFLFGF